MCILRIGGGAALIPFVSNDAAFRRAEWLMCTRRSKSSVIEDGTKAYGCISITLLVHRAGHCRLIGTQTTELSAGVVIGM